MPGASVPVRAPLGVTADIPAQQGIRIASLARDPSRLEFREVRLEEADLVLSVDARGVGGRAHDAEVVPDLPRVDRCRGLGDQFCPPHRLAIPE